MTADVDIETDAADAAEDIMDRLGSIRNEECDLIRELAATLIPQLDPIRSYLEELGKQGREKLRESFTDLKVASATGRLLYHILGIVDDAEEIGEYSICDYDRIADKRMMIEPNG